MNMELDIETTDAIDGKIKEIIVESMGTLKTEMTEDLIDLADSLSELSVKLYSISNYVEDKIEEAHLRRGVNMFGDALREKQIETYRNKVGHSWVATVSCECGAGEFCNTCGFDVIPGIKLAVSEFLES